MNAPAKVLSRLGEAAVEYAERGWHVFPLAEGTKHIHLTGKGGYHNASCDLGMVREWWSRWPDANIGLNLEASGLLAVDVDSYKPDCGWATFIRGRDMPATLVQRSARGGIHYIFKADQGQSYSSPCAGVDLKQNGYVLLEPSTFEGGAYQIETDDDPAPCPEWVPRGGAKATKPVVRDRSGVFQSAVNKARLRGKSFDQTLELLRDDPAGTGAIKYLEPQDRLEAELARSWTKAGDLLEAIDLSQDALALGMGKSGWDRDARYVAKWGKWLFWDGTRWKVDERREDMTRVRAYLRGRAEDLKAWAASKAEGDDDKEAKKLTAWADDQAKLLRHKNTVAAVESLAQSNPDSAAGADDFDGELMLLGTPGGTVDLRTGVLRPALREDAITKHTTCAPAPPGTNPSRWLAFLSEVFNGDQELVDFMQRAAGYALTGMTTEHKLLFLYGTGRNGKSVFLNTLFKLWGDYARKAAAETFLNSRGEGHPTDVAGLHGARLVVGSELPRGKTWDESVIKDLTGGDKMTARFMRQDYFDFDPQLTLMIAGNTQPSFRGVDEAIRSRVVLVPFTVTIPKERRDTSLPDKLMAEGPAILRWVIDGALAWQREGLNVPHSVAAASEEYFEAEDTVGQFLSDETETVVGHFETSQAIYARFESWCFGQGLSGWTKLTLVKELRGRGFVDARMKHGRGLKGLKLL